MNLFFFVYHEIEFHNYFPTAMELKKKNKDTNIFFIFTNKKNYESIIETKYLHSKLKKKFNILVLRSSGNKILQKFITLQNYIHFFLKFIFLKKPILFFPKFSMLGLKVPALFCRLLGGKIAYLSPDRFCHSVSLMPKKQFEDAIFISKKNFQFFNFFVFFNKDNFNYEFIKKKLKIKKNKILHIGLPILFESWKNFINKQAINITKSLKKKYSSFTSIYTIIGDKNYNDNNNLFNTKSSKVNDYQYKSLKEIINSLKKIDPKCIVFFKKHPRQPLPEYLKKVLREKKFNRIILTSINVDILALISKRFFFTFPSGTLTHINSVNKIDLTNYNFFLKKNLLNRKQSKSIADGFKTIHVNNNNKKFLEELLMNERNFNKKNASIKELKNIESNISKIDLLIEKIIK